MLAFLVKILNFNFWVKVSEMTIKQSFTCTWYWMDKANIDSKIWWKDQEKQNGILQVLPLYFW